MGGAISENSSFCAGLFVWCKTEESVVKFNEVPREEIIRGEG